jgi:hypothetical protein
LADWLAAAELLNARRSITHLGRAGTVTRQYALIAQRLGRANPDPQTVVCFRTRLRSVGASPRSAWTDAAQMYKGRRHRWFARDLRAEDRCGSGGVSLITSLDQVESAWWGWRGSEVGEGARVGLSSGELVVEPYLPAAVLSQHAQRGRSPSLRVHRGEVQRSGPLCGDRVRGAGVYRAKLMQVLDQVFFWLG